MDNSKDPKEGGIVPIISEHYQALPLFYDFENTKIEQLSDKISRQFIMGSSTMLVKWILKKGAEVPLHYHPHEQITWITQGSCRVLSQGKSFIIKAGQSIIFPPYVPHEFVALEDTIDIDFFAPVRGDWFNDSASYLSHIKT